MRTRDMTKGMPGDRHRERDKVCPPTLLPDRQLIDVVEAIAKLEPVSLLLGSVIPILARVASEEEE